MDSDEAQTLGSHDETCEETRVKRQRKGPTRGPSRALKYKKIRRSQPQKLAIKLSPELGAVVGERANQFIAECGAWTRELCPLDVLKWSHMPSEALDKLFERIKAGYELPTAGYIDKALEVQCSNMYRNWRTRLKRDYFNGKPLEEFLSAVPDNVDANQWRWLVNHWNSPAQKRKSEVNRANALSLKIRPANGAKSTARILDEMVETSITSQADTQASGTGTTFPTTSVPIYIKAYERLKRHSIGYEEEIEEKKKQFWDLHESSIKERGVDDLTIEEAFLKVLGHRSGYARGLGKGNNVITKGEKKQALNDSQLRNELDQLKDEVEKLRAENERIKEEAEARAAEARAREEAWEAEESAREKKLLESIEAGMQAKIQEAMQELRSNLFSTKSPNLGAPSEH